MPLPLRVLVVDDYAPFVDSLVSAFRKNGVGATGCSKPWEILSKSDEFDFDLILLDMRLGTSPRGDELHAHKLLPHLKTYAPSSKVVVFSQHDITVKECLRCIELGALTVIPKSVTRIEELCLVGEVYDRIGDEAQSQQELIDVLWEDINSSSNDQQKGRRLEMLVINLFNSMPTFKVVGHNMRTKIGEIDVLVENDNRHPFWQTLKSLHLVVECKHEKHPPEPDVFSQLLAVVKTQGEYSKTGIVVSMSNFTGTFRSRQNDVRCVEGINLLGVGREHLERLVALRFDGREEYLRSVLQQQ